MREIKNQMRYFKSCKSLERLCKVFLFSCLVEKYFGQSHVCHVHG
jgi:hypothetical protein